MVRIKCNALYFKIYLWDLEIFIFIEYNGVCMVAEESDLNFIKIFTSTTYHKDM